MHFCQTFMAYMRLESREELSCSDAVAELFMSRIVSESRREVSSQLEASWLLLAAPSGPIRPSSFPLVGDPTLYLNNKKYLVEQTKIWKQGSLRERNQRKDGGYSWKEVSGASLVTLWEWTTADSQSKFSTPFIKVGMTIDGTERQRRALRKWDSWGDITGQTPLS